MESSQPSEREVFERCLELPEDERQAYLDRACGGDDELRARVLRLLAAHERAEGHTDRLVRRPGEPEPDPEAVGPFRILERLGEGGMGVVYAAEQTRPVRRRVALKLIKRGMDTREVIARFSSERQALALMSHPNIARMFDAGATEDGLPYFVMELVQGIPLTDYCDSRRLGIGGRLELFRAVCSAVQHAHQKGVIHRDLKPSNVLVTEEGGQPVPKVIDFGVAKATGQRLGDHTHHTELGRMVGTLEYMSPEQAESTALELDTRADVYSLGVLLYELLTGSRPFEFRGTDRGYAEIQRIIREQVPDAPSERARRLGELVPTVALRRDTTPATLVRALSGELDWITTKALAKEPRDRYQTPMALADDLERAERDEPVRAAPPALRYRARKFLARHRAAVGGAALVAVALVTGGALASLEMFRERLRTGLLGEQHVIRSTISLTGEERLWLGSTISFAVSPDGSRIAYVGAIDGQTDLYVRDLDSFTSRRIRDSEGARGPFFSPDGAWLAFFTQGRIRRVAVGSEGAVPETVVEVSRAPRGASWSGDDRIVYSLGGVEGLMVVDATGGEPRALTVPDPARQELEHQWPEWLPDDRGILFTITRRTESGTVGEIAVLQDGQAGEGSPRVVLPRGTQASYASSGHLVYADEGTLAAVPFHPGRFETTGAATTVLDAIGGYPAAYAEGASYFSLSRDGTLLYMPPRPDADVGLAWVGRDGTVTPVSGAAGVPGWPRISPDGRHAAIHAAGPGARDVWVLDLDRPGSARQLTHEGAGFPVWSPDGARIAFMSRRSGTSDLYVVAADGSGTPERMAIGADTQVPVSWAGDLLVFYRVGGATQRDLYALSMTPGGSGPGEPFLASPANELAPALAPDARWIAYVSNATGRNEVYLRAYPPPGPVTVVSIDGGAEPVWSRDGRTLYYRHEDTIMAVPIETLGGLRAGRPTAVIDADLVDNASGNASFDVTPDGDRFLVLHAPDGDAHDRIHLVLNWFAELEHTR